MIARAKHRHSFMFVMSQYCCIANCTCQNRFISPIPIFRLTIFAISQLSVFLNRILWTKSRHLLINWNKLRKFAFMTSFCNSIINFLWLVSSFPYWTSNMFGGYKLKILNIISKTLLVLPSDISIWMLSNV